VKTLLRFLCVLAVLCWGATAYLQSQSIVGPGYTKLQQTGGMPWQLGGDWGFTSSSTATGGFDVRGISYYRILWVPNGTVSSCSLSIDSATSVSTAGVLTSPIIGGIISAASIGSCATAGEYVTTSAAGISAYGQITPTITGSGNVIVVLFGYTDNPQAGGGITGTVSVSNFPSTYATQPAGFSSIAAFQQAVTASAVVLATNSVHGFCVKALSTNSITVYVGPSGVTDSTGYPLGASDSICYQGSNTNLAYVIASTTGASVAVTGN